MMTPSRSNPMMAFGRVLLGLYFLLPGLFKIAAPAQQLALMEHHGVPFASPLLLVAGIVTVVGALFLMTNRYVRLTSLGFVLYILVINAMLHDFWNFTGVEAQHETQNFVKNLGILAGLLVLAGASPWRAIRAKGLLKADD